MWLWPVWGKAAQILHVLGKNLSTAANKWVWIWDPERDWQWRIVGMHSVETTLEWEEGIESERGRHCSPFSTKFALCSWTCSFQEPWDLGATYKTNVFTSVLSSNQRCINGGHQLRFWLKWSKQVEITRRTRTEPVECWWKISMRRAKWKMDWNPEKKGKNKSEKATLNLHRNSTFIFLKQNIHSSVYFLSECLRIRANSIPFDVCGSDVARGANL